MLDRNTSSFLMGKAYLLQIYRIAAIFFFCILLTLHFIDLQMHGTGFVKILIE